MQLLIQFSAAALPYTGTLPADGRLLQLLLGVRCFSLFALKGQETVVVHKFNQSKVIPWADSFGRI